MKPITLQEIKRVLRGKSLSPAPAAPPPITSVCTDTRQLEPGCLFVALKGDRFDGQNFLPAAAAGGAVAALVDAAPALQLPNVHLVQVDNTRTALGKLATHVRKQMMAKVIGVAGSNGKTSTKHLIDSALCGKLRGSISPKSFNNDIGVPLTIFPADPLQDYLVLEMGTNHPGEIKTLTDMARPDIAVLTNCSAEHLEFLGDVMGVRRENATVIEGLNPRGCLIVNGDDPELLEAVSSYPKSRTVTFGFNKTNDLFATDVECSGQGVRFTLNSRWKVFVPLLGRHTAANALAAIAVARRLNLSEDEIVESLAVAHGPEMRLQLQTINGVSVLNDAYNANPASMRAALETLATLESRGRRVAILGDMRELGDSTDRFHREVGEAAAACPLDELWCVGEKARLIGQSAEKAGAKTIIRFFDNAQLAGGQFRDFAREGDLVLLKASRAVGLERVAKSLLASGPASSLRLAAS